MSKIGQNLTQAGDVILRPYLTEKAGGATAAQNAYTFAVAPRADKVSVTRAIQALYKVKPRRVNLINLPAKRKLVRGRWGRTAARRKAVVYLKAGDKIE